MSWARAIISEIECEILMKSTILKHHAWSTIGKTKSLYETIIFLWDSYGLPKTILYWAPTGNYGSLYGFFYL